MIVDRTIQCFTPTEHELHMIENRLKQYSNDELKHLEANFTTFGVDAILECILSTPYRHNFASIYRMENQLKNKKFVVLKKTMIRKFSILLVRS